MQDAPKKPPKTTQISIRVPTDLLTKLDAYNLKQERTRNYAFVRAMVEYLGKRKTD